MRRQILSTMYNNVGYFAFLKIQRALVANNFFAKIQVK